MSAISGKNLLMLGFIVVLLVTIPIVVILLKQQQQTKTTAAPTTTLSFSPSTATATSGAIVNFDVIVNPGQNQVSFVKLDIIYDKTKLETSSTGTSCADALCPATASFPSTLEGPTYNQGEILVSLSVGADPTRVVQTTTKVATVTFKTIAVTGDTPTQIKFGNQTQVLSIATADQPSENVWISNPNPASITITGITPTATPGPTTANQLPICTALNIDRTPSGTAPFSITFTVSGNDPDGTISKTSFNFGDGPVQDVTQGGGIGTKTVSAQIAHTYHNAGTFTASATLTDGTGGVSNAAAACSQTITVTGGPTGTSGTISPTSLPTPTSVAVQTQTPTSAVNPSLSPGPEGLILGIGGVGIALTVLGGLIFLIL